MMINIGGIYVRSAAASSRDIFKSLLPYSNIIMSNNVFERSYMWLSADLNANSGGNDIAIELTLPSNISINMNNCRYYHSNAHVMSTGGRTTFFGSVMVTLSTAMVDTTDALPFAVNTTINACYWGDIDVYSIATGLSSLSLLPFFLSRFALSCSALLMPIMLLTGGDCLVSAYYEGIIAPGVSILTNPIVDHIQATITNSMIERSETHGSNEVTRDPQGHLPTLFNEIRIRIKCLPSYVPRASHWSVMALLSQIRLIMSLFPKGQTFPSSSSPSYY
jgi:hypothetical protein